MDFNTLQAFANRCVREGRYGTAIAVYLHMTEGDPSLDGGSLAHAIGECYEKLGDLHAARYWFGPPERTRGSISTSAISRE